MPLGPTHTRLINRMRQLGYKSNNDGVCYGLTAMAMHAILLDKTDEFYERLRKILSIPIEEFTEVRLRETSLYLDVCAFFDGIEAYYYGLDETNIWTFFQPSLSYHFEPPDQCIMKTAKLVLPQQLIELGGIDHYSYGVTRYNLDSLKTYFIELETAFQPLPFPISMVLFGGEHVITLGYDITQKKWHFVDTNQLDISNILNTDQLAEYVHKAFASDFSDAIIMGTTYYVIATNKEALITQLPKFRTPTTQTTCSM